MEQRMKLEYIEALKTQGSFAACNQAQAGACPQNQAQDKQARDRHTEFALLGCAYA